MGWEDERFEISMRCTSHCEQGGAAHYVREHLVDLIEYHPLLRLEQLQHFSSIMARARNLDVEVGRLRIHRPFSLKRIQSAAFLAEGRSKLGRLVGQLRAAHLETGTQLDRRRSRIVESGMTTCIQPT